MYLKNFFSRVCDKQIITWDLVHRISINRRSLSALDLKLLGFILGSRVDIAGDNQNPMCQSLITVRYSTLCGNLSVLEFQKRKSRSHGKRQKGNDRRKICNAQKSNTSLNNLSTKLREHGRHAMLSFLSSLPSSLTHVGYRG